MKKTNQERYQTCLYSIHRDGRLKFIKYKREGGKALPTMPIWDPARMLENTALRDKSILPKYDLLIPIAHSMKEALKDCPKGEESIAVKHALYKLGKDFGVACDSRHGMIYWTCNNPPHRRAFAFQIQTGKYSERKAAKLLKNKAIYRCVVDVQENGTAKIIGLKRRSS